MQDLSDDELAHPRFGMIPRVATGGRSALISEGTSRSLYLIRFLLIAVACAQFIDVISTNQALAANPDAFEANPAMRLLMSCLGSWWWLWKAGLAAFFLAVAVRIRKPTRRQLVLSAAMVKIYALALINNFLL